MEATDLVWRKSSRSSGNSNCVEVARVGSGAFVRDTKNRTAGALEFGAQSWTALLGLARDHRL